MNPLRVLIVSNHYYPASIGGLAGCRVLDCLAKGLAELGHEVYCLLAGSLLPPPPGVTFVSEPPPSVDIVHVAEPTVVEKFGLTNRPWVRTRHVDSAIRGVERIVLNNTIYVSQTLAGAYGSEEFIWNGIDPDEFLYAENKRDYLLFLCGLERAMAKGLDVAIRASQRAGVPLVFAGSSTDRELIARFSHLCAGSGVEYLGEVWGTRRALLIAEARALLFPTKWNESFGLVMVEALMSGTPVICSSNGACPELITPGVGFICHTEDDYLRAILHVHEIAPAACRAKAMRDFHYRKMAAAYAEKYCRFLAQWHETGNGGGKRPLIHASA